MTVKFAVESFDQCWQEGLPLFVRHKDELASYEESVLSPDAALYEKANAVGMVVFFTARDDGRLIGYAAYWLRNSLHYTKELWASSDTIIIMPEYRNMGLGDEFYEFIEEKIRELGVVVIQTSWRANSVQGRALGMLLARHGCERMAITHSKRLG